MEEYVMMRRGWFVLLLCGAMLWAGSEEQKPQMAPVNQEFLAYQALVKQGKAPERFTASGFPLGEVPSPKLAPKPLTLQDLARMGVDKGDPPPASYDLRTTPNKIPPSATRPAAGPAGPLPPWPLWRAAPVPETPSTSQSRI